MHWEGCLLGLTLLFRKNSWRKQLVSRPTMFQFYDLAAQRLLRTGTWILKKLHCLSPTVTSQKTVANCFIPRKSWRLQLPKFYRLEFSLLYFQWATKQSI